MLCNCWVVLAVNINSLLNFTEKASPFIITGLKKNYRELNLITAVGGNKLYIGLSMSISYMHSLHTLHPSLLPVCSCCFSPPAHQSWEWLDQTSACQVLTAQKEANTKRHNAQTIMLTIFRWENVNMLPIYRLHKMMEWWNKKGQISTRCKCCVAHLAKLAFQLSSKCKIFSVLCLPFLKSKDSPVGKWEC